MGDWIPLLLPLVAGIGGVVVAFDYRNLGQRFYDLLAKLLPGGIRPDVSPDRLRVLTGLLGMLLLVITGVQAVGLALG